jgi:hypothetical protein
MAPKIRVRIPHSLMGVTEAKGRTALFQEGFAVSGKEFRSRQSVGRRASVAALRSRAYGPAGSRRRFFYFGGANRLEEPASEAPGLHRVFMRDKGLKFVIADSAFKRKQVDARACRLDTGEHHRGLALRTSGAPNCSEWNGGRKALRLGHDAFPRIGGSATLSARWFELTTKGRPRTRRPNLAGFSLLFAGGGLLLLTRRIAMLLGNSRKSGGPPPFAPSFKVKRDVHS